MQDESLKSIGQTFSDTQTSETSTATETGHATTGSRAPGVSIASTSSAADSHARTSATPASAPESTVSVAACGPSTPESSQSYTRASSSSKTLPRSGLAVSLVSSVTLPRAGTMRSGTVYPQQPSAPLTAGTGYSWLPTLAAREWKDISRAEVLARLDRGDGVAKRICALSPRLRSSPEIVGLNPFFAEWLMGFPIGWTALED
jgi:hypothetical protein